MRTAHGHGGLKPNIYRTFMRSKIPGQKQGTRPVVEIAVHAPQAMDFLAWGMICYSSALISAKEGHLEIVAILHNLSSELC